VAATIVVKRWTGAAGAPTKTDITGANTEHVTADAHYATGGTSPIPVPAAGSNYGFWVSTRACCSVSPAGTVNNLKVYLDGANSSPAGVTWLAQAANVGANAGYRQAAGTVDSTGDELNTTNHMGLTGAPVNPFTWTSASPKSLTGSITNPSTGDFGDFLVSQLVVANTVAQSGPITAETIVWQWDET
jgi:hypothetical protein